MSDNQTFKTLSAISLQGKIERKGNLDYLSWANAWSMLKQNYPNAQRKVYESEHTGLNFFSDGKTAYVKVGIIVDELEHIDYLPVMDYKNNAIPIERVTAMDINKTIQRSTAKAIAMHGLGLSLWTGEDIPAMVTDKPEPTKIANPVKTSTTTTTADVSEKPPVLSTKSEAWSKVTQYVQANKNMGVDGLVAQLSRKYSITPAVKKAIDELLKEK